MSDRVNFINIQQELESKEYKEAYKRHLEIFNSFLSAMVFIKLDCNQSERIKNRLFCLSVIDDLLQSLVAIKSLSDEGIRNPCRRELRYMIELTIKACLISQKETDKTTIEQIDEFRDIIKSTNISMVKEIDFYFFTEQQKGQFITEIKRFYGELCTYVHSTPRQMQERIELDKKGRYIGFEGTDELRELDDEIGFALSCILCLFFHTIPQWCVGDYLVERTGYTVDSYFSKYKYFAMIDEQFDYKCERQDKLKEIQEIRKSKICY